MKIRQDFRHDKSLSRKRKIRQFAKKIVVVCEGSNTEKHYLEGLVNEVGNGLVDLVYVGGKGAPTSLLAVAKKKRNALKELASKTGNSFDLKFSTWIVFDVDDWPKIEQVKNEARANDIGVACSNPCFELWLVYHHSDCNAPHSRQQIQKLASKTFSSYNYKKGKKLDFAEFSEHKVVATKRAKHGLVQRASESAPEGNPSTTFVLLVEEIMHFGNL